MYCPSCGTELMQEMSYCNRCGASLKAVANQEGSPAPRASGTGAAWAVSAAVAFITLGGFALIFALVMTLVSRGLPLNEEATFMVFAALAVILIVDWLLIRQLPRFLALTQGKIEKAETEKPEKGRRELGAKPAPQLGAPREPASSVTDHTTRTFEPVPRERNTQR